MQVFLDKTGGKVLQFCEHSVIIACNDSICQIVYLLIPALIKIEFLGGKDEKTSIKSAARVANGGKFSANERTGSNNLLHQWCISQV